MELSSKEITERVTDLLEGQEGSVAWVAEEHINLNLHPVVVATLQVLDERGFLKIVKPESEEGHYGEGEGDVTDSWPDEYQGADHD